jgi:hypothetical protein
MVLDLYDISDHATGGAPHSPIESKYVAATLMPVMVVLGGVYRFWGNQMRPGLEGKKKTPPGCWQFMAFFVGFVGSCTIFGFVVESIVTPTLNEECPDGYNATGAANATGSGDKCPITDENLEHEALAVQMLTLVWVGYVFVSAFEWAWQAYFSQKGYQYSAVLSLLKDVAYSGLDVTSKGGLALYLAYRHTWLT